MKKVLLLLLLMIHGVANAQEHELLVSEIENSGCISYARGSEASNLSTIILKKDGTVFVSMGDTVCFYNGNTLFR